MKKLLIITVIIIMIAVSGVTAYASAFVGTTDYYFESGGTDEFYRRGEQQYNFEGEIPPELLALYDFSAPTVYTSEYGANIILPDSGTVIFTPNDAAPQPLPATPGNAPALTNLPAIYDNNPQMIPIVSSDYPDTWAGLVLNDNPYTVTPVEELRNADGSIGRLQIPAISLDVKVYDGDELAAMKKGVGHIEGTSVWDSNVGMVGHNRGTNNYFGKLKTLSVGDIVTYTTNAGKRTYVVSYVGQIDHTDWSMLRYTLDNRLTLVTCVEDVPSKRVVVQCVEVR